MDNVNDTTMKEETSNPFQAENSKARRFDLMGRISLGIANYTIIAAALAIFFIIFSNGASTVFDSKFPFVNVDFLTKSPETLVVLTDSEGTIYRVDNPDLDDWRAAHADLKIVKEETIPYAGGGILGPLVGSALLVVLCMIITLFVGISTAIFLSEYAKPGTFLNTVRLAILNLAGVPSIVFGIFGFGFFCLNPWFPVMTHTPNMEKAVMIWQLPFTDGVLSFQGWENSLIAGAMTLAIMVLPVIITACEESLKAVPKGFREASLALGASKWQSIRTAVLPYAFSGMLTASILGVTRVAGETAPIMFTAAVAYKGKLPWEGHETSGGFWLSDFLTQQVQAMPYHIYTVAARIPDTPHAKPMQHGSVFVFMLLVMGLAFISVLLRNRIRKKIKW